MDDFESKDGSILGSLLLEPLVMGAGGMILVDPLFQRVLVQVSRKKRAAAQYPAAVCRLCSRTCAARLHVHQGHGVSSSALENAWKPAVLSMCRAVEDSWSGNLPLFRWYHSRCTSSGHSLPLRQVVMSHESDTRKSPPVASKW